MSTGANHCLPFLVHLHGPNSCCLSTRADTISDVRNSDKVYLEPTILGFLLLGCRSTDLINFSIRRAHGVNNPLIYVKRVKSYRSDDVLFVKIRSLDECSLKYLIRPELNQTQFIVGFAFFQATFMVLCRYINKYSTLRVK